MKKNAWRSHGKTPPRGNDELRLVLEHVEKAVAALEDLIVLMKRIEATNPRVIGSRDLIVAYLRGTADHLEREIQSPHAPPGAAEGCAEFVRGARALAAAIEIGAHLTGGADRSRVDAVSFILERVRVS